MGFFDKLSHHNDLVMDMAGAIGADPGAAMARGQLDPARLRSAVMRCMGCDKANACGHWIDTHPGATEAPDYCLNRDLLDRLRPAG